MIELLSEIQPWHVMCLFVLMLFIGWCILRNRETESDSQRDIRIAREKAKAEEEAYMLEYSSQMKANVDTDLNETVVMAKNKK